MNIEKWISKNTHSLKGATVAISGSTGGLGEKIVHHLASLGASLTLLDRNEKKAERLMSSLKASFPEIELSYIKLDLEDFENVLKVAESLKITPPDYLILNAGAYHIPTHKCDTGYQNVFQINFVSPYYIARELLPYVKRVVAVGSIAHNYSKIDPSNVDFTGVLKSSKTYGNAKRYLMYSLLDLADSEKISVVHPGITFTNITAHYPKFIFALIKHPMKVIFMGTKKASLSIINGLFDYTGRGEWIGPRVFNVWGFPKKKALGTADEAEARKIVEIADEIYTSIKTKTSKNLL